MNLVDKDSVEREQLIAERTVHQQIIIGLQQQLSDATEVCYLPPSIYLLFILLLILAYIHCKQGHKWKFIWGLGCFLSFLFPFLFLFLASPPPALKWHLKSAKGFGECSAVNFPQWERTTFAASRHVPGALNTPNCVCGRVIPQISSLDLIGRFEAGQREGRRYEGRGRKGTRGTGEKTRLPWPLEKKLSVTALLHVVVVFEILGWCG